MGIKITVGADVSDFEAELRSLEKTIDSVWAKLKTREGASEFNLNGAKEELDEMLEKASKLAQVMGDVSNNTKLTKDSLKEATKVLEKGANVAKNLENVVDDRKNVTSNYIDEFARDTKEEIEIAAKAQKEKIRLEDEATKKKIELQKKAARDMESLHKREERNSKDRHEKMVRYAGAIAGLVAGTALGGTGFFSGAGTLAGTALGSLFGLGPVGGALGGAAGGAIDRSLGPNKNKLFEYSELRRSLGGLTTSFSELEESTQKAVKGLLVTNIEAVSLARQFSKAAVLTEDSNKNISKAVGTSAEFGLGYAVNKNMVAEFLGQMRHYGVSKDQGGDNRLLYKIGEGVSRSGTMTKMDDTMTAILSYVRSQTGTNFMPVDVGSFMRIMTNLTSSKYFGMNKDPMAAAGMMERVDKAVRQFGIMGEASENFWLDAIDAAGISPNGKQPNLEFAKHMRNQGAFGSLRQAFAPGNAYYDAQDPAVKREMDEWREAFKRNKIKNMTDIGIARARAISTNSRDFYNEIAGAFNLPGGEEAAIFIKGYEDKARRSTLEKHLAERGQKIEDVDMTKLSEYFQVAGSNYDEKKKYFENIKERMTDEQRDRGRAIIKGGNEKELQDFLYDVIDVGLIDKGQEAKQKEIQMQNDLNNLLETFVGTMTKVNNAMISFIAFVAKLTGERTPTSYDDILRETMSGNKKDTYGLPVGGEQLETFEKTLVNIRLAKTMEEKKKIAEEYKRKHPAVKLPEMKWWDITSWEENAFAKKTSPRFGIPSDFETQLDRAVGMPTTSIGEGVEYKPENYDSSGSYIGDGAGGVKRTMSQKFKDKFAYFKKLASSPHKYDEYFKYAASKFGLPAHILKTMGAVESEFIPTRVSPAGAVGVMQIMPFNFGLEGLNEQTARDPLSSIMAGASHLKRKIKLAGGNFWKGVEMYNGSGPDARAYRDFVRSLSSGMETMSEDMPYMDYSQRQQDSMPMEYRQERGVWGFYPSAQSPTEQKIQLELIHKNEDGTPKTNATSPRLGKPIAQGVR